MAYDSSLSAVIPRALRQQFFPLCQITKLRKNYPSMPWKWGTKVFPDLVQWSVESPIAFCFAKQTSMPTSPQELRISSSARNRRYFYNIFLLQNSFVACQHWQTNEVHESMTWMRGKQLTDSSFDTWLHFLSGEEHKWSVLARDSKCLLFLSIKDAKEKRTILTLTRTLST